MTRDSSEPISDTGVTELEGEEVRGASIKTETTQSRHAISRMTQLSQSMIIAPR